MQHNDAAQPGATALPGQRVMLCLLAAALLWTAWHVAMRTVAVDEISKHEAPPLWWPDMRIDVNTASAAELSLLPGVGPRLADRIIAHRDQFGPFESLEQLDDVFGIGPRIVDRARDHAVAAAEH